MVVDCMRCQRRSETTRSITALCPSGAFAHRRRRQRSVSGTRRVFSCWAVNVCSSRKGRNCRYVSRTNVAHAIVGAGDRMSYVLAVGRRIGLARILYPPRGDGLRHRAGVERDTPSPTEAYARFTKPAPDVPFREAFLPTYSSGSPAP
jgi:hypothetical protein